ncbi:transmembrane protein 53 [Hordeum vulgare]|nr:transmembrane protein 53 [Hordeum vulgare]
MTSSPACRPAYLSPRCARLPFSRAVGVLTSDGARVAAVDGTTDEILVNDIFSGTQARLPKPPLAYNRLILNGGYVFSPATDRTEIQYCSLCYNVKGKVEKNVELLSEHLADWVREEDGKNIVFHTFSNTGWLCYGVILENLQRQDPSAVEKIKGSVIDSAPVAVPDSQVWALGFSAAIMKKNSVTTKGAVSNDTRSDVIVVESQNDIRPAATEAVLLSALEKFFDIVLNYPAINSVRSHLARYIEECRALDVRRGDTNVDLALHNSEGNLYHVLFRHGRMSSKFHGSSWEELVNDYGLRHDDIMTVRLERYGTMIGVDFHRDGVMLFPLPCVALEDLSETQRNLLTVVFVVVVSL